MAIAGRMAPCRNHVSKGLDGIQGDLEPIKSHRDFMRVACVSVDFKDPLVLVNPCYFYGAGGERGNAPPLNGSIHWKLSECKCLEFPVSLEHSFQREWCCTSKILCSSFLSDEIA